MKKIFTAMALLILSTGFTFAKSEGNLDSTTIKNTAALEETESSDVILFDYAKSQTDAIDVSNLKSSEKVEEAIKEEAKTKKGPRFKFDEREINKQRAINFSTEHTNSMRLPL